MGNDDLKNALMRAQGVQGFMGGGMATHAMPDGTVMPGATHGQYQAMGYQEGGPARRGSETGAVINDVELRRQLEQMTGSETSALNYEPSIRDRIVDNLPLVPETVERMMMSSDYKNFDLQKQNFINALLAKETGAVIKDSEMAWANQTYFPQMGDSPQTIELKRQAREQAIQQMEQDGTPQGAGFGRRMRQSLGSETGAVINDRQKQPAQELQEAIQQLEIQKTQTSDPDEIKSLDRLIEVAIVGANAPLREMSLEMQAQGRGEDTALAHLRPGEVILPPEAFEDAQFEDTVARKFEELGIDPEEAVAGVGIASLNPMTGLEEFGFFKKIGKAIKKVAKFIAPIAGPLANFIPGVGPLVAGAIGAATNVVGGKGLSGAISGGLGGYGFGKALGGIGSLAGGTAKEFAQKGFGAKLSALGKGLGSLPGEGFFGTAKEFLTTGVDDVGLLGNLQKASGYMMGSPRGSVVDQFVGQNPNFGPTVDALRQQGQTEAQILEAFKGTPGLEQLASVQSAGGLFTGGGRDGVGNFGRVGDFFGGAPQQQMYDAQGNPVQQSGGFLSNLLGLGGGGGGGGLGSLAMAGVPAYMLGKMAYDEAKADKGVALTPLTTMGPTGRYNIEAEIARRMGTQAPNPVEFGLLPQGTFPQLSGGQPMMAAGGGAVYPMAYAEGGNVSVEDFERMNGDINGPGTETSDDVPAMLSDGEFVMTGAAVRGAGGFDMQNQGGILTLTPSGTPDRERGTNVMHEMMDLFGSYANAPA